MWGMKYLCAFFVQCVRNVFPYDIKMGNNQVIEGVGGCHYFCNC